MEQKRVSFAVAKAIKEFDYPQGNTEECYIIETWNNYFPEGQIVNIKDHPILLSEHRRYVADIPTYLDVWIWLWREKKITITCAWFLPQLEWFGLINDEKRISTKWSNADPEQVIIESIEYLVENNMLK